MFGPHTIELDGMPMGRTPEYMQERLRRFFSKFGIVKICRAIPHELDPYQCQGKAYVTFRDRVPPKARSSRDGLMMPSCYSC